MTKSTSLQLNAIEYGIEESKAKQLEAVFVPMVEKFKDLESQYNEVLENKEITEEVCHTAKSVRLKYQKVRTGADAVHKEAKAGLLVQTRAIDGMRNIIKYAVIDHENSLKEIENHFERIEEEKRKEREERLKLERELQERKERERKAQEAEQARIQAELNKGDAAKVKDLITDLIYLKSKYSFKSAKNKKMYNEVGILIDKIITHIN